MTKPVLTYNKEGDTYNPSPCGWTMEREGNPNHWCLRKDGEYVDRDKYRIDLAERNGIQLGSEP